MAPTNPRRKSPAEGASLFEPRVVPQWFLMIRRGQVRDRPLRVGRKVRSSRSPMSEVSGPSAREQAQFPQADVHGPGRDARRLREAARDVVGPNRPLAASQNRRLSTVGTGVPPLHGV